jgi:uroporphyrinogen decarboxylase
MTTDREIFFQTVRRQAPSRQLYHFSCTPDLKERVQRHIGQDVNIRIHYGSFSPWRMVPRRPNSIPPADFSRYWHDAELPEGTKISARGVAELPGSQYHFTRKVSPLRNAASLREIEEYPILDNAGYDISHYPETIKKAHAEGRPTETWAGHMYEIAWAIRGYEQFLEDLLMRPAWTEALLDKLFHNNLFRAEAAARAGLDAIYCADDVANQSSLMFSPDLWRHFFLSRWKKVWQSAKAIKPDIIIHYHSDGNIFDIIPDLIEAGLDILNPLQPECLDIDTIYREYGKDLTFDGLIGTQTTMPFGSPEDVKKRVRECRKKYGKNGGLILSPTHTLQPETPIENIEAFVEACRE